MKLSTSTLPLPSGEEDSEAVAPAGHDSARVVLLKVTMFVKVAPPFEGPTFTALKSRIEPRDPVRLTTKLPPAVTFNVAVSLVLAGCDGVNLTLITHPGAAMVVEPEGFVPHVSVSLKSLAKLPPNEMLTGKLPLLMLTLTC